jgi:hypothetical protein
MDDFQLLKEKITNNTTQLFLLSKEMDQKPQEICLQLNGKSSLNSLPLYF